MTVTGYYSCTTCSQFMRMEQGQAEVKRRTQILLPWERATAEGPGS